MTNIIETINSIECVECGNTFDYKEYHVCPFCENAQERTIADENLAYERSTEIQRAMYVALGGKSEDF